MSSQQMQSIVAISQRFRSRLQLSLDELGFARGLRERSHELSFKLNIHESVAAALLMHGTETLPDITLILRICDLTQKPIGWFLDPDNASFPSSTRVVHSIGSGEDLAISLPEDIAGTALEIDDQLHYFRARSDMGFGVNGGDHVITLEVPVTPMSVTKNRVYLFGSKEGFALRHCVAQSPLRASFTSFDGKTTQVLKPTIAEADRRDSNFQTDGMSEGMHHFSQVVCVLKAQKNIPRDGSAFLFIS